MYKKIKINLGEKIDLSIKNSIITQLREGGLVVVPTETVYGVIADATKEEVVNKVNQFKKRKIGKVISIMCADKKMAEQYVELNQQAEALYESLLPGPYTIISEVKKGVNLPAELMNEKGGVGVRIPDVNWLREIVAEFGRPLTATSANISGGKNPYTLEDVMTGLREKQMNMINLMIDGGKLKKNEPSVVIDTMPTVPVTLRGEWKIEIKNRSSKIFESKNEVESREIIKKIVQNNKKEIKKKGLVITLDGLLGAGKTTLAGGISEELGLGKELVSPTYNYVNEYAVKPNQWGVEKFYHADVWKVENEEELKKIGIETWVGAGKLTIIEWFEKIEKWWSKVISEEEVKIIKIKIEEKAEEENRRIIRVKE